MDLNKYQEFTRTTAIYPKDQAIAYLGLGLTSEAGEVSGKIKKMIRDGGINVMDTLDEIGDVLWYATRLCDEMNFSIEECFKRNQAKLQDRLNRHQLGGSGDKR